MFSSVSSSMFLTSSRLQHHLLAVAHLDAGFLQREQHRRLHHVDAHRHVADAFGIEDSLDLFRRVAEQRQIGSGRAPQAEQSGAQWSVCSHGAYSLWWRAALPKSQMYGSPFPVSSE